jgi:hypothetical protein
MGNSDRFTAHLREISDGYADALRPMTRARILASARQAVRSTHLASPFVPSFPRLLTAAAIVMVLALPALHLGRAPQPGLDASVRDLQVTSQGGQVVLTWKDGTQPRHVVRTTSHEDLARMSQLPGEVVSGERWVDAQPSDAEVVYYLVE